MLSADRSAAHSNPTNNMDSSMFSQPRSDQNNHFSIDDDSSRKRKRHEGDEGSPNSNSSQKRHMSPSSISRSETLPPIANGTSQPSGAPYTTQEPNAQSSKPAYQSPPGTQWQNQRLGLADDASPENRLVEVLGSRDASTQPQTNGNHAIPPINGHSSSSYPSPGDQQQSMSQSTPNGALPALQNMSQSGLQKQRKRYVNCSALIS